MQSNFGSGYLFGVTTAGLAIMFAALQDVNVDFSGDLKSLHGRGKYPVAQAQGKSKIDVKAISGAIDPKLFNQLYWGGSSAVGQNLASTNEAGSIPATSTYIITVTQSANFSMDLGVLDVASGAWMTKVASGPIAGQYSVAAGVYTFAAADEGKAVKISYTYTSTTGGLVVTSGNPDMGSTSYFKAVLANTFEGKQSVLTLFKCASSKLSMPFKQDDFTLADLSFAAQDDGTGNVFTFSAVGA